MLKNKIHKTPKQHKNNNNKKNVKKTKIHTTAKRCNATSSSLVDPPLSELSKRREPSPIRALIPLMAIPGMKSLGSGLPNPAAFPLSELSFKLKNGTSLTLTQAELNESLQYGATPGSAAFLKTLKSQMLRDHALQYDENDFAISVTGGSQDGLTKAFEMLINPGDHILVEKPTYSGALGYLRPLGAKFDSVEVDGQGLIPEKLEEKLKNANPATRPKVLYTIATGQNPSGCTTTTERKAAIYQIAQKYNLTILEDDPYFNLCFGTDRAPADIADFNPPKPTSYLSMDTDGRVLRFDSFSKILSAGLRLGTVSGSKKYIDQLNLTTQVTNLHTCGLSQVLANKILTEWGPAGWDNHVKETKYFYAKRRDLFVDKMKHHLGDMVDYNIPDAGMFIWMAINPKYVGDDTNAKDLIQTKAVNEKVLLLPGEAFLTEAPEKMYVRASFSVVTPEDMDIALERFKGLILKEKDARGL